MDRPIRGPVIGARAPLALLLVLVAAACEARLLVSPSVPPVTSPSGSPAGSPRLPTPVPTPAGPSNGPSPADSPVATTGRLLLRLTSCSHACGTTPGTTFLDDGRLLWEAPDGSGQVLDARLTADGIATVREAIESAPALAEDGSYIATVRPGAEPIPHGVSSFRFDVQWEDDPVVVTSWDPASIADEPQLWVVPPEMTELADLAQRLGDPVAWLGVDAFDREPVPYVPEAAVVRLDLFHDVGEVGGLAADVDDIAWPFGEPIETAGEPIAGEDPPEPRCVLLDGAEVAELRAAEARAGAIRDTRLWESVVEYDWKRGDGFVQVTVRALLPYQTGSCAELLLEAF